VGIVFVYPKYERVATRKVYVLEKYGTYKNFQVSQKELETCWCDVTEVKFNEKFVCKYNGHVVADDSLFVTAYEPYPAKKQGQVVAEADDPARP
jgi:hypothetical protein